MNQTDHTLSAEDLDRIRTTYGKVRMEIEPASTAFYDFLFSRAPRQRRLFRDDLAGQGMKFMTTLGLIVEALDQPGELSSHLRRLGRFHGDIGIVPTDFEPMEEALMDTLDLVLGEEFSAEDQAAWRRAYRIISREMIATGMNRSE